MADEKPRSTTKTLSDYFGRKEGQNLAGFAEELKALSADEKQQLAEGIINGSLTY